ncbi:N-acetyltransferase [Sediminihabitans luteus]|nr:N-acetyltransferase [Sediminihabitans luteus]
MLTSVPWADPAGTALRREMFERTNLALYPDGFGHLAAPGAWEADDTALGLTCVVSLVVTRGGAPVGHAALRTPDDGAPAGALEVSKVYVRAEARRTGVASALLVALEDAARARGARLLVLGTGPRQPEAAAAYVRHGYARIDGYPPYDSYGDALCFGKRLA